MFQIRISLPKCVSVSVWYVWYSLQVTYTGRLGAAREKAQVFLGAFYGVPLPTPHDPPRPEILVPLEQLLLSKYHAAREDLVSALEAVRGEPNERNSVRERYQTCLVAQTRLARLRHYVTTNGETPGEIGGVFSLHEAAARLDHSSLSLSQLSRLAGCLINTMLILSHSPDKTHSDTPALSGNRF